LRRRIFSLLAASVAVVLAAAPPAGAQTTPTPPAPAPTFAAALLVDADTGHVLYEKNAHARLRPASLTKTLTALIAADWLPPTAQIPVTAAAFNAYPDKVGMKPGQKWPLSIALHALITDSANDAAYALAIDVAGSLPKFGTVMDLAAAELGLSDQPVLHDPAGLDRTEGVAGGNLMSAWDLAVISRAMMANPRLAAIAIQQTYDFVGPDHIAYHIVSRNLHFLRSYPGAVGVKTGYTDAAGFCDIEEADKGGRHMLAVVLHSDNPDAESATLLGAGFSIPVSHEAGYPSLPAVRQPFPLPPLPPTTTSTTAKRSGVVKVAAADPGPNAGSSRGWPYLVGAALLVSATGLATRQWVRRRRPIGAHGKGRRL
jgi:D-alanyl-D-alanine carboxypeptidase (penicillin-binding protein 5/6)